MGTFFLKKIFIFYEFFFTIIEKLTKLHHIIHKMSSKAKENFQDKLAYGVVKFMRFFADLFFSKRYGNRAIVLETVAGVPGMVGGVLIHLKSLRLMKKLDHCWIKELLDEAENERMHLKVFIELYKPTYLERILVMIAQGIFFNLYFIMYLISPKICHRIVGYLEEEAVISYTRYLEIIDNGTYENINIPAWSKEYWKLEPNAKLRELVEAIRADEMKHRDVNHGFADILVEQELKTKKSLEESKDLKQTVNPFSIQ